MGPYLAHAASLRYAARDRGRLVVAGAAFAATTAILWKGTPGSALLGTALFPIGALVGDAVWRLVERPTRRSVLAFVTLFGVAYPALTGIVDPALRARTP